jgi:hypothetical protein
LKIINKHKNIPYIIGENHMKKLTFLFIFISVLGFSQSGLEDSIISIQDSITIKEYYIQAVPISNEFEVKLSKAEKEQVKLLERRVRVVYPYAKVTAEKLTALNANMAKLKTDKEKKKYFKLVEKYLNDEFEPRLKKLSQKQGQILVKLIHRQTGNTTFDLIKQHKSGWKAFWSNNTAKLFNINLKEKFSPLEVPEDYYIESFLIKSFEDGILVKQAAASPVTEEQLQQNWRAKNAKLPAPQK